MISKDEEAVLNTGLASEKVGKEVAARIINSTPQNPKAAQAILDTIDNSKKIRDQIKEYLIVSTTDEFIGCEISKQLDLVVEILGYQANPNVANNASLIIAQSKQQPLSNKAKEYLNTALGDSLIGESIFVQINTSISSTSSVAALNAPTASVFNGTQTATFPFPTTTDILSITTWVKFDSSDTDQQIFCMDCLGTAFQLYWTPNANVLSYKFGGVFINDFVNIDSVYHQITCVYNNVDKYIELIIDKESKGVTPIPLTGPDVGITFVPGMEMRVSGYNDIDTDWMLKGKMANMEFWTEALNLADATALYDAGYYQHPESLVDKSLIIHYLMGDNTSDTPTFVKDNKGTSDLNYVVGSVSFDTEDLPRSTPFFPWFTAFLSLNAFETVWGTAGPLVDGAYQPILSPAVASMPVFTTASYSYLVNLDNNNADVLDDGFANNFNPLNDFVFTFDITEFTPHVVSGATYNEIRIVPFTYNDTANNGVSSSTYKTVTIVENAVSVTLTAAEIASYVGDITIGRLTGIAFISYTDGVIDTVGSVSIDNLTITNA